MPGIDSENWPTVKSLQKLNILFFKKDISTYQDGLNRIKNVSQLNDRADLLLHPSSDKAFYIFVTHVLKLTGLLDTSLLQFFENLGRDMDANFRGINEVRVLWFSLKIFLEILYSWYWFWHIKCSHSNFWWYINLKNYYLIKLTVSSCRWSICSRLKTQPLRILWLCFLPPNYLFCSTKINKNDN